MLPSTSPNTFYHIGIMPSWILVQSYVQKHSFLGEIFSPGSWWFVLPFISMHLWITFWGTRLPQDTFLWLWVLSYVQGLLFHFFNQTQEHQKRLKKTIPLWTIMQCFHKQNLAMRTSKSKALQWERRDLLSRMRPKCGVQTQFRPFADYKSLFSSKLKAHFATKVRCCLSWKDCYIIPFPQSCMSSPLFSI